MPAIPFADEGAELMEADHGAWGEVDGVLCVRPPAPETLARLRPGSLLVGLVSVLVLWCCASEQNQRERHSQTKP